MSTSDKRAEICPHCGAALVKPTGTSAKRPAATELRYDLLQLAARAAQEHAYDETVKVRVTQDDIRKLLDKRKKARK